jgi:hypothetical protein
LQRIPPALKKQKEMIAQNELRLGNWIKVKDKNYQVIYLSENGCGYDHEEFTLFDSLEPIFITGNILQKAGFSKDDYGYKNGSLALNQYEDVYHLRLPQGTGYGRGIKYLHQLQNLYFNIAGQELTIKP